MTVLTITAGGVLLTATAAATGVALFQTDPLRRRDALQVLRIALGTTVLTGTVTAATRLHEVGLL
jgi:integral membrane sensor domain MASE1